MTILKTLFAGRHKTRPTVEWREELKIRDKAKQLEGLVQVLILIILMVMILMTMTMIVILMKIILILGS